MAASEAVWALEILADQDGKTSSLAADWLTPLCRACITSYRLRNILYIDESVLDTNNSHPT